MEAETGGEDCGGSAERTRARLPIDGSPPRPKGGCSKFLRRSTGGTLTLTGPPESLERVFVNEPDRELAQRGAPEVVRRVRHQQGDMMVLIRRAAVGVLEAEATSSRLQAIAIYRN